MKTKIVLIEEMNRDSFSNGVTFFREYLIPTRIQIHRESYFPRE